MTSFSFVAKLVRHYKINSTDNSAYLNRAALVGCNNEKLSQDYANQLFCLLDFSPVVKIIDQDGFLRYKQLSCYLCQ
jgi:hypothetical protein